MIESAGMAVDAKDLTKSYGNGDLVTPVLQGVDLQIPRGESWMLVGPSGSGKSTLLSILGCILTPDSGQLEILGRDVTQYSASEQARFRRTHIGFVFQRFHLFRGLRAWENVKVAFDLLGTPPSEGRERSLQLLDSVGLSDRAYHHTTQMSVGQLQRIAIARALAGDPELILADEPTASLDERSGQEVMAMLRQLVTERGSTAIIVTHDHRILKHGDRVCVVDRGRVAATEQMPTA